MSDIKTLREAADVKLITFHTCFFRGDHYDKHDPVDINPAYIVAVYPMRATAGGKHSQLRLHGDTSPQDWLMVHESPDDVRAAILCRREAERMEAEGSQEPARPRLIDLCYTVFMMAKEPNKEDGGPSDWFTDTLPRVEKLIAEFPIDSLRKGPSHD